MKHVDDKDIDSAIFTALGLNRYKVARVIGDVVSTTGTENEHVAKRIAVLVSANKLQAFGNIDDWRHSEISLRT